MKKKVAESGSCSGGQDNSADSCRYDWNHSSYYRRRKLAYGAERIRPFGDSVTADVYGGASRNQ